MVCGLVYGSACISDHTASTEVVKVNLEDNIKMDLQEVGRSWEDWMELAQDRNGWRALVGTVRNLRVPKMRGIS